MKRICYIIMILIMTLALAGCGSSQVSMGSSMPVTEVMISAAGNLKPSFDEIAKIYAAQRPDIKLVFNYGSSGSLQEQIEQGAAPDIFISAGKKQMDDMEKEGLIISNTRVNLLGDELVVIVGKNNNNIKSFTDLTKPDVKYIGIGELRTVPAAQIAQETLSKLKLWNALQPKLVEGKDLMEVLSYVSSGNAQAGFVWRTIAMTSDQVKVALTAPTNTHEPIVIPAAVVSSTKHRSEAEAFLKFLQSNTAMKVFLKHGFTKVA